MSSSLLYKQTKEENVVRPMLNPKAHPVGNPLPSSLWRTEVVEGKKCRERTVKESHSYSMVGEVGKSDGESHLFPSRLCYWTIKFWVQTRTVVFKKRWNCRKSMKIFYWSIITLQCCWNWMLVVQLCPTLCNPVDSMLPGPLSMEFSRQQYWSGLPFPSPGDLPDPRIET